MNPNEEYLVLDALDTGLLSRREADLALQGLAGNQQAAERTLLTIQARKQVGGGTGFPSRKIKASKDENFDYESGADSSLRALLSFGETPEDQEAILRRLVGEEGYTRDSAGRLALTEAGQAARGIDPIGKNLVIEDEGFSFGDIADLAGLVPETAGAIGGAILTAPSLFGMAAGAGLGAAFGQTLEEGVESLLGVQTQTAGEVAQDVATEALLAAGFELGGGLVYTAGKAAADLVGFGARKAGKLGDIEEADLARGERLLEAGALPSIERLGGPRLLAYQAKLGENVLKDETRRLANTQFALDTAEALRTKLNAVSVDDAAEAIQNVGGAKYKALKKAEADASDAALKAVRESIDHIEKATIGDASINDITLERIADAFSDVQRNTANKFQRVDDLLEQIDLGDAGPASTARIIPTQDIRAKLGTMIDDVGAPTGMSQQTRDAIKYIQDLPENASFAQLANARKSLNDAIYNENAVFSRAFADAITNVRNSLDDAINGANVSVPKGVSASQRRLLREAAESREEAMDYYKKSMQTFDDLQKFGIIRNLKNLTGRGVKFEVDKIFDRVVQPGKPETLKQVLEVVGDNSEVVRSELARAFLDDAMTRTGISKYGDLTTGQFSGKKFENQIKSLGGTGKVLFGDSWDEVQRLAETIALAGPDKMSADVVTDIARINSQNPLVDTLRELAEAKRLVQEADQISVFRRYNEGTLTPEEAVSQITQTGSTKASNSDVRKIINFFRNDPESLDRLRGLVVEDILSVVDGDVFSSPAAAGQMLKIIQKNRANNVALDELLGKKSADALEEFAKDLVYLGDSAKEGSISAANLTANPIKKYKDIGRLRILTGAASSPQVLEKIIRAQKARVGTAGVEAANDRVSDVVNATTEKLGRGIDRFKVATVPTRQLLPQAVQQQFTNRRSEPRPVAPVTTAPTPVQSSGIGSVDVTQPLPPSSKPTLREMATNDPAVAAALGIRGPTAGLL